MLKGLEATRRKLCTFWMVKCQEPTKRDLLYLLPCSTLCSPPYLVRLPTSSVISGIQLAKTAYIESKASTQTRSLNATKEGFLVLPFLSISRLILLMFSRFTSYAIQTILHFDMVGCFTWISCLKCKFTKWSNPLWLKNSPMKYCEFLNILLSFFGATIRFFVVQYFEYATFSHQHRLHCWMTWKMREYHYRTTKNAANSLAIRPVPDRYA